MAKKKGYYAVTGPEFKGIIRSHKEYQKKVNGKKNTFGKQFFTEEEAQYWIDTFISPQKTKDVKGFYAVHTPDFKGVVKTLAEYNRYIKGKPKAFGKRHASEKQAQQWLETFERPGKKGVTRSVVVQEAEVVTQVPEPRSIPQAQEIIIYIDGGFKDGIGKYGLVAYSPRKIERVYQNFGYVYDEAFNELSNAGAELMACLRALEWAYSNGMKIVHIIYDFEGITDHLVKVPNNAATKMYQEMVSKFRQHMQIHFLHIRHGNKELHNEAHKLTQLVV